MHSSIPYPGEFHSLIRSLNEPLHATSRRDFSRQPQGGVELSLSQGYQIDPADFAGEPHIVHLLADLREFLEVVMEVQEKAEGVLIRFQKDAAEGFSLRSEAHQFDISSQGVILRAETADGLRRAIFRLQDEMLIRNAPIVPMGNQAYESRLHTRISRNPLAPYRWLSGWELEDEDDYYPEAYLNRIAHAGINGLWIPGLFRNLIASREIPEMGRPQHRLGKLRRIVERAGRYGIRIYLFCIEPRALPEGHPALRLYPELIGPRRSLCISQPRVQAYLREACETLASEVPGLGGVINIFCGERYSNCWADETNARECPRCRERTQAEVHSAVLNSMVEGLKADGSSADLLAWTYLMASSTESLPITPMLEVMEQTDPRVIWLGNYEHGGSKTACGREVEVHEYSLSCLGPSPNFRDLVTFGKEQGRTLYAKLQLGNSYELSSLPWITVPGIAVDKIFTSAGLGSSGAMLGWIVGGVPGPMIKAAGEAIFSGSKEEALYRTAAVEWGEKLAATVVKAWEHFAQAWQGYPFHNALLYWGPLTRAPSYPLYLEQEPRIAKPYNWGLDRQRHRQPFENDPGRWLGSYTAEEITTALRWMAGEWEHGLQLLRRALAIAPATPARLREWHIAEATRLQLLATANIYEFNTLRLRLLEGENAVLPRMSAIAQEELSHTEAMIPHMQAEPWIGYQSEIFAYSYSLPMLHEKCEQLRQTLARLCHWQEHGIERSVLETQIADIEEQRPDDWPDLFGD